MAKFKFVFTNADVVYGDAEYLNEAAIKVCASRLNAKKSIQVAAVFAQDVGNPKLFKQVKEPVVTINLK